MLSDEKISLHTVVTFKCPKCGRIEKHIIDEEDLREIKLVGISRIGFIHGEHSLVVSFDSNGFVRGAYIIASDKIPTDIRVYYGEYLVLNQPKFPVRNFEIVIVDMLNKVIDIRLSKITGSDITVIMGYLDAYKGSLRGSIKRVGVAGKSYSIMSKGSLIVLFNNISSDHIRILLPHLDNYPRNPYAIYFGLNYLSKKQLGKEEDKIKERLQYLLNSDSIKIRAKKGTNAIRFARASIIALWPELSPVFDMIINDPQIKSDAGISLLKLLLKKGDIDFDELYEMLRELKKRGLLEVIMQSAEDQK